MTLSAARGTTVHAGHAIHGIHAIHVVHDPAPGQVLSVPAGARLALQFRRGLGLSRWQVADRPGCLLPLEEGPHGFLFLVFGAGAGEEHTLRLVRRRTDRSGPGEVRELTVRVG